MPDIKHQFIIKANARRVFEALTSPEGLNSWWSLESSGKPALNEIYRFYFGPVYDWRAKVIAVKENESLTWQMTEAMDDWKPTQVGFTLTEKEGKTTVNFFHTNWAAANDHFAISTFCWGTLLTGLKNFVEHGIVVPFELRN